MKVTIVDVAKKANVSVATVSRVVNGNYPVKAATKEKVLQIIEELQYTPNMQARDLIKQKSSTIGVVVPSLSNMFFTEVINGIESYFNSTDYSIFLCITNHDSEKEIARVNELLARNVAGIIVVDPTIENCKSKYFDNIAKENPIVFVNGYNNSARVSSVSNDEKFGGQIVMDYLIDNNHKNILFIRGGSSYSYDIKEKVYRNTMKDIKNLKEKFIINIGQGNSLETVSRAANAFEEIISQNPDITAVFACNDLMAMGVVNACKKLKKKIPEEISIIGYDNIELSEMITPKLTTVDQNMFLLGENAAILVIEKIENDNKYSKKILLNNTMIKRET